MRKINQSFSSHHRFGILREYPDRPSHNPDDLLTLSDLSYSAEPRSNGPDSGSSRLSLSVPDDPAIASHHSTLTSPPSFAPFKTWSVFALMNWMWTGSPLKSLGELNRLVHGVLLDERFKTTDLVDFNAQKETTAMDKHLDPTPSSSTTAEALDGWRELSVPIQIPDGKRHEEGEVPAIFQVPGLYIRSLTHIIKSSWGDPKACGFHTTPFKEFWRRKDDEAEQRIYGEMYSSDAFIQAHNDIQRLPKEPDCTLERVVCGMMVWSDSTHCTNFGDASMWPIYLSWANQSKYVRGKPRAAACHHVAYIPKVRALLPQACMTHQCFIASRYFLRLCTRAHRPRTNGGSSRTCSSGTYARCMAALVGRRIHACIRAWHHCSLFRWSLSPPLPSLLYVLG